MSEFTSFNEKIYRKLADQTVNNSVVFVTDTHLQNIRLTPNTPYILDLFLLVKQTSAVAGIKTKLVFNAVELNATGSKIYTPGDTAEIKTLGGILLINFNEILLTIVGACPIANDTFIHSKIFLRTLAGDSIMQLQWAQAVAEVSDTILSLDSYISVKKL